LLLLLVAAASAPIFFLEMRMKIWAPTLFFPEIAAVRSLSLITLLVVMLNTSCLAQDPVLNGTNVGFPPNGVFSGSHFDSVQVNNANLHIEIPLWTLAGRGLPTTMKFKYDSKSWRVAQRCTPDGDCTSHASGGEPISLINPFSYSTRHGNHPPESPNDRWWFFSYVLTEPDGTSHHFVPDEVNKCLSTPCPLVKLYADDGSGWQITVNSQNGVVTGPMINKDGTGITIASDGSGTMTIEDTNGNQIVRFSSFTGGSYTDTLGREMHFNPSTFQLDGAYYDSTGVLRSIVVQKQAVTFQTQLCQFKRFPDNCTERTGSRDDPHIITLPDGTSYTIDYVPNSYGQPSSITLPTGGQITYTWHPAIDASGPLLATRTVTADGQSATWSYAYNYTFNPFTKVAQINATTVTDPAGNDTVTSLTAL
jgi:hypothetical protein